QRVLRDGGKLRVHERPLRPVDEDRGAERLPAGAVGAGGGGDRGAGDLLPAPDPRRHGAGGASPDRGDRAGDGGVAGAAERWSKEKTRRADRPCGSYEGRRLPGSAAVLDRVEPGGQERADVVGVDRAILVEVGEGRPVLDVGEPGGEERADVVGVDAAAAVPVRGAAAAGELDADERPAAG